MPDSLLGEVFQGKELTVQIPNGRSSRTVKVTIPAGIPHGMRVSVPKSGTQHNLSMPPGDLYVTVLNLPHQRFVRDGYHLITTASVSVFDVLLGKETEVINIENKPLTVSIPPGFDANKKLRLAGQGMPDPYTSVTG